jgi:hypothetical protein
MLTLYQIWALKKEINVLSVAIGYLIILLLPSIPFLLFISYHTGNPVFPYYNALFQSPFAPSINIEDSLHGPKTFIQLILWPIWIYIYPENGSEFFGRGNPYCGRISLTYIFAFIGVCLTRFKGEVRTVSIITLMSIFLWSISSGNLRYGIFIEILGGIVIILILTNLLKSAIGSTRFIETRNTYLNIYALILCVIGLFSVQMFTAYQQVIPLNNRLFSSNLQPTSLPGQATFTQSYFRESQLFLRDRKITTFLTEDQKKVLEYIEVWINCHPTTVGLMSSLKPDIPIISVTPYLEDVDIYDPLGTEVGRQKYMNSLNAVRNKRIYSLTHKSCIKESERNLYRAGLCLGAKVDMDMPFYSYSNKTKMTLIEILPPANPSE